MPLVAFHYLSNPGTVVNGFQLQVELPHVLKPNTQFWLRSVQAVYFNTSNVNFRFFEIELPEIFNAMGTRFIFSSNSTTGTFPEKRLRYYVNKLNTNTSNLESIVKTVTAYPNLNLGRLTLDSPLLTLKAWAARAENGYLTTDLRGFTVLLEYEDEEM